MAPLVVLVVVSAFARSGIARRRRSEQPWPDAVRVGLAAMFLVTGGSHFVGMRDQLIAMVPPSLPAPALLISVTGVLEIFGAAGLLWRRTTCVSGVGLALMLVGMFPANVYAATHGLQTEWLDNLLPRILLQLVFLAAVGLVVRGYWPVRGLHRGRVGERISVDATR